MGLFRLRFENKTYLIFITSIIWSINFRTTFKNIYAHMGLGSYAPIKFEPLLYLIKNIICCFYLIGFFIENRQNQIQKKEQKVINEKKEGSNIIITVSAKESNPQGKEILEQLAKSHNLYSCKEKTFFIIKVFFMILFIYLTEDAYFIFSNDHVIDRVVCPMRNFSMLISISIFSIIFLKKSFFRNRHQLVPFIIIFILSLAIIAYNMEDVDRFKKKFSSLNTPIYVATYFCMGIEMVFIKMLTDNHYLSIYFILGAKGIIGTFFFTIINILFTKDEFFNIFDKAFEFEYDGLNEDFSIYMKIGYILSLVALEFAKVYTINQFSENHLLSSIMIEDILFFPFYCVERFAVQGFGISSPDCFWMNTGAGIINTFLMLIFNEILECNFWGLNTNLKRNIDMRQSEDYSNNKKGKNQYISNDDTKSDDNQSSLDKDSDSINI